MNKRIILILAISSALLSSCTKKEEDKAVENRSVETVDPSASRVEPVVNKPPGNSEVESAPVIRDIPVQPENVFLSGRTDFLSLPYGDITRPEGFDLGELYTERSASEADKAVIEISRTFMDNLAENTLAKANIKPERLNEIKDFWEFFIKDRIAFEEIIYGLPLMVGNEIEVSLFIKPDGRTGRIFLSRTGTNWLVTGFEMDLREKSEIISTEKWAPSLNPLPVGY